MNSCSRRPGFLAGEPEGPCVAQHLDGIDAPPRGVPAIDVMPGGNGGTKPGAQAVPPCVACGLATRCERLTPRTWTGGRRPVPRA